MADVPRFEVSEKTCVLVDTSMLVALMEPQSERHEQAALEFKGTALTCDEYLLLPPTLKEFEQVLRAVVRKGDSRTFSGMRDVVSLLNASRIRSIRLEEVFDQTMLFQMEGAITRYARELQEIKPRFFHLTGHHPAIYHDSVLLAASETLGYPILTMDQALRRMAPAKCRELAVPFPFDLEALRNVSLRDALNLAEPLRHIYKHAFSSLRAQASSLDESRRYANKLAHDLQGTKADLVRQQDVLWALETEITKLAHSENIWRLASRPSGRSAIVWTVTEGLLAALGLPVPTSPFVYFIDVLRHERRERELGAHANSRMHADARKNGARR